MCHQTRRAQKDQDACNNGAREGGMQAEAAAGSQDEAASVAGGIDAGKEERRNLGHHLLVGQRPAFRVARLQQQVCEAPRRWLLYLDVLQQAPHNALHTTIHTTLLPCQERDPMQHPVASTLPYKRLHGPSTDVDRSKKALQ